MKHLWRYDDIKKNRFSGAEGDKKQLIQRRLRLRRELSRTLVEAKAGQPPESPENSKVEANTQEVRLSQAELLTDFVCYRHQDKDFPALPELVEGQAGKSLS